MILRRVYKSGNSWVVALPGNMLDAMGFKPGDLMGIEMTQDRKIILVRRSVEWKEGKELRLPGVKG